MNTGENEQGLRKILDLTRMISIAVLLLHFYYYCYGAFREWGVRADITDRLLQNIHHTGLFSRQANEHYVGAVGISPDSFARVVAFAISQPALFIV